jgi:type IV pilus assembly protein PilC
MSARKAGHTYRWQGLDGQGRHHQGVLESSNTTLALAQLHRQGYAVQSLQRQWWTGTAIAPVHVAAMTRQCTTLLQAGLSLVPALQLLQRGAAHPAISAVLRQVQQCIESGMPFSQALAQHPDTFSPLYIHMVHAGETAGILDTMLERLAQTLEKNEALRARVRSALTYPCTVTVIAMAVLVLMLLFVVPVFEDVFKSFGAALPMSTQAVLALSRTMSDGAPWLALSCLVLWPVLRRQWQQPHWQRLWHRRVLDMPGLGTMVQSAVLARWAHTLSALLAAGVPLTEALPVAGKATGHPIYTRINEHLQRRVAQGGRLSEGMAHTGRFPDMLVQLCATGEDTGTLDTLLERAARLMTEALDARVQALSSLIEPLIIVVLGGAIGVILMAMYLPIFRLGQVF